MTWTDLDLPILIVSLARSVRRRELMARQMAERAMAVQFLDALDGHDIVSVNAALIHHPDDPQAGMVYRRTPISTGELACTVSHLWALRRAADAGWDRVLILEDDVLLGDVSPGEVGTLIHTLPVDAAYGQMIVTGAATVHALAEHGRAQRTLYAAKRNDTPTRFADPTLAGLGCHAAAAYLVTRAGLDAVADAFDDQGRVILPCAADEAGHNVALVADRLIYQRLGARGATGYAFTRPTFRVEATDSLLHPDHIPSHVEASLAVEAERAYPLTAWTG